MAEPTTLEKRKDSAQMAEPVSYALLGRPMGRKDNGVVTIDGHPIDSPAAFEAAKETMIKSDLRVNRLAEMGGYLRWATIGALGMTFTALTLGSGLQGGWFAATGSAQLVTALGAAVTTWPFLACVALTLVVGTAAMLVNQRARKVASERSMDVGAFMQEREAELVGKAVGKSLTPSPARQDGKSWGAVIQAQQADQAQRILG